MSSLVNLKFFFECLNCIFRNIYFGVGMELTNVVINTIWEEFLRNEVL